MIIEGGVASLSPPPEGWGEAVAGDGGCEGRPWGDLLLQPLPPPRDVETPPENMCKPSPSVHIFVPPPGRKILLNRSLFYFLKFILNIFMISNFFVILRLM